MSGRGTEMVAELMVTGIDPTAVRGRMTITPTAAHRHHTAIVTMVVMHQLTEDVSEMKAAHTARMAHKAATARPEAEAVTMHGIMGGTKATTTIAATMTAGAVIPAVATGGHPLPRHRSRA